MTGSRAIAVGSTPTPPDPDPANIERLAALLVTLKARHVGLGDFKAEEFPVDPTNPEDLQSGANFRLEYRCTPSNR